MRILVVVVLVVLASTAARHDWLGPVVHAASGDDGNVADASIVGRVVLALGANADDVQTDDEVSAYAGMGGQGVLPIPLVYNGWVQKLPQSWKNLLTEKQRHPIQ